MSHTASDKGRVQHHIVIPIPVLSRQCHNLVYMFFFKWFLLCEVTQFKIAQNKLNLFL